ALVRRAALLVQPRGRRGQALRLVPGGALRARAAGIAGAGRLADGHLDAGGEPLREPARGAEALRAENAPAGPVGGPPEGGDDGEPGLRGGAGGRPSRGG